MCTVRLEYYTQRIQLLKHSSWIYTLSQTAFYVGYFEDLWHRFPNGFASDIMSHNIVVFGVKGCEMEVMSYFWLPYGHWRDKKLPTCRLLKTSTKRTVFVQNIEDFFHDLISRMYSAFDHMCMLICAIEILNIIIIILINNDFLKHKQANINVKNRRFGVIVTPLSRQSE